MGVRGSGLWTPLIRTYFAALILSWLLRAGIVPTSNHLNSYPSTSKEVCEQGYGGSFATDKESSTCTVAEPEVTTLYVGFGASEFDWVQTTKSGAAAVSGEFTLGPATVGCRNPGSGTNGGAWALDCM